MRLGLVARADERGLGRMSFDFYRHMHPYKVLVVREPGAERAGFVPHLDRYPGATVVTFTDGGLDETTCREWLTDLDVVYGAETWYDARFSLWAARAGVRTVLHAMPEFFRPEMMSDFVWVPTSWRLGSMPEGTRLVPVPVDVTQFPMRPAGADYDGPLRVLHVVGHQTQADRNGTSIFARSLRLVRGNVTAHIACQDSTLRRVGGLPIWATVQLGGVDDHHELYAEADVLVLPRRFGGLSLPVQEAMAAGLAVVMPDCSPNTDWPIVGVPSLARGTLATPSGNVRMATVSTTELARTIDRLANNREELLKAQAASVVWAQEHSWGALRPLYEAEFERCLG